MYRIFVFAIVTFLVQTTSAAAQYATWQTANRHSFCQNFAAGREADGRPLYVSQFSRTGINMIGVTITIGENGDASPGLISSQGATWHVGKAGVHLKEGMTYSYGGGEYDASQFSFPQGNQYQHLTFCLTELGMANPGVYSWIPASGGQSFPTAVKGYNTSEGQVVCRAQWAGGVHPGKLIPSSGACYFGYGGGEKAVTSYEVLVFTKPE